MSAHELTPHLCVSDVSVLLKRSRASIKDMIERGILPAYNAAPENRRKSYRVRPEDLAAFMSGNAARPPAKKSRRVAKPVREYV